MDFGTHQLKDCTIEIPPKGAFVGGQLVIPPEARGVVVIAAPGSPRSRYVVEELEDASMATLSLHEQAFEDSLPRSRDLHPRSQITSLTEQTLRAADCLKHHPRTQDLPLGCFGAGNGGTAVLLAAERASSDIAAIACLGARPVRSPSALAKIRAPTLLIVTGDDDTLIDLNRAALPQLGVAERQLTIISDATHAYYDCSAFEDVARITANWFVRYLSAIERRTIINGN